MEYAESDRAGAAAQSVTDVQSRACEL